MKKIKRALCHNIRTSGEIKYVTGDNVFYKREDQNEWRRPGDVIGQVNQQVFVNHGNFYIRVHPCRFQLVKPSFQSSNEPVSEQSWQDYHNHQNESNVQNQQTENNSFSDSENYCSDNNEAPPQNEHRILVYMTSHKSNHQDTHSTTNIKEKISKNYPKNPS